MGIHPLISSLKVQYIMRFFGREGNLNDCCLSLIAAIWERSSLVATLFLTDISASKFALERLVWRKGKGRHFRCTYIRPIIAVDRRKDRVRKIARVWSFW